MVVTFDTSLLTSYYSAKANLKASTGSSATASNAKATTAPTAPWRQAAQTEPSALVRSALGGSKLINVNSAKLDIATDNADYRKLFGMYQGLQTLTALADAIGAKGLTETEKNRYRAVFSAGLKEIGSFLDANSFNEFQLTQGGVSTKQVSASGVKKETDTYLTKTLFSGTASEAVDAFAGDMKFTLQAKLPSGTVKTVDFDLSEMGSTTRSMSNVVLYLNDKLAAEGVQTRFANVRTPGTEKTAKVGNETIKLGMNPDTFALKIVGTPAETLTFSAPETEPAVYLGGQVGGATINGSTTPTATSRQLLKYSTDATPSATTAADAKVFANTLASTVQTIRQTVTAPDGSVYVLGEINGATDGQAIKGKTDVALLKYDSSGNLLYTRTLGAASEANGYALAVSEDGKRVAVAGSVTGALDEGDVGRDANETDSFLAVFDDEGDQIFSDRRGASAADEVTGVTFGADGVVYVQGSTNSAMTGLSNGGQDVYVRSYKPAASASAASAYSVGFTMQYGTSGADKPAGVAINGSTMVVASVENGQAVVRRYDLQATGAPVLGATRNLGDIQGGIAGIGFADDGSLIVAGTTTNGALSAGTVTSVYGGAQSVFVAKLEGDLAASADDRLTYYGADDSTRTATGVTVAGGKVYVTGQVAIDPPAGQTKAYDGYAAAIDADTGAVSWSKQFVGADKIAAPTSIAVDVSGASVLDKLGLPKGTIDYTGSELLVANTSVRAGDQFYIRSGTGLAKAVTIEASDTLKTLATKIGRATGFTVKAEVVTKDGFSKLQITPLNDRYPIEIDAGKVGRDALRSLGLSEGLIALEDKKKEKPAYGLQLTADLSLDNDGKVKQAQAQLLSAISTLKTVYTDMTKPAASTTKAPVTGEVPAYLSARIASYQSALARLTGS